MEPGLDPREHQTAALRHDCELWRLSRVQSIFGGTTEIMKEIIDCGLGLEAVPVGPPVRRQCRTRCCQCYSRDANGICGKLSKIDDYDD